MLMKLVNVVLLLAIAGVNCDPGLIDSGSLNSTVLDSLNSTVGVLVKPEIDPLLNLVSKIGENITFSCAFRGDGPLVARWTSLNGSTLTETSILASNKTHILNRTVSDVLVEDMGVYTCEVENDAGKTSLSTQLSVHTPPIFSFTNLSKEYIKPPINVELVCLVAAYPEATWTWYFNGSLLCDTENCDLGGMKVTPIEVLKGVGSKLNVSKFAEEHYGNYTCIAKNEHGNDSFTMELIKKVPPQTPSLKCVGNNKNSIQCTGGSGNIAADSPTNYIVYYLEEKDLMANCCTSNLTLLDCKYQQKEFSNSEQFWITNMKPGTRYVLQILASNQAGESDVSGCIRVSTESEVIESSWHLKPLTIGLISLLPALLLIDMCCCLTLGKGLIATVHKRCHRRRNYRTHEPTIRVSDLESNQNGGNVILLKSTGRSF